MAGAASVDDNKVRMDGLAIFTNWDAQCTRLDLWCGHLLYPQLEELRPEPDWRGSHAPGANHGDVAATPLALVADGGVLAFAKPMQRRRDFTSFGDMITRMTMWLDRMTLHWCSTPTIVIDSIEYKGRDLVERLQSYRRRLHDLHGRFGPGFRSLVALDRKCRSLWAEPKTLRERFLLFGTIRAEELALMRPDSAPAPTPSASRAVLAAASTTPNPRQACYAFARPDGCSTAGCAYNHDCTFCTAAGGQHGAGCRRPLLPPAVGRGKGAALPASTTASARGRTKGKR